MANSEPIYITGHMHPDTDSVVAAIAYAFFKKAQGIRAIPCRLGPLNQETKALLKRFGFEEPMLLKDARKTLGEIELDPPSYVSGHATIYSAISMMDEMGKTAFGVTDDKGRLVGMVTKSDLTTVGLGDTAKGIDLLKSTPVKNIAETLDGTIVYDDDQYHPNGKVSIIALTATRLENYEIHDRIVIVGDDPDAQEQLIRKGAALLIVVWAQSIADNVIEAAKEMHCPIILSGHGCMNTSRYIYFAPQVRLVMKTNLVTFQENELAEDAGKKLMQSRYRTYPVLKEDGTLAGYVSRYHILNYKNKKLILVDHNEFSQSVRAVEKAQLLEVVDHHRICDFATTQPVSFRNEIVGSTATIIATMFRENQIPIPKELAGLLLGAVLSDTLIFQSPTTTEKDRVTANILAALADLDIETFGAEIFDVQSDLATADLSEILKQDIKFFEIHGNSVMICQVPCSGFDEVKRRKREIQREMDVIVNKKELALLVAVFTSVKDKGSVVFAAGEKAGWAKEAFPDEEGEELTLHKGLLSRKSQILPKLTEVIGKYS